MESVYFTELPAASGKLGVINLNRCQALNALTVAMVSAILQQLQQWAIQPEIFAVVMQTDCERAFSSGGDLRALYEGRSDFAGQLHFFEKEYQLNYAVGNYPKPIVVLLQGIVMGGGVGISVYASHRVACENLNFSMPETAIGLFPDVGSSYFFDKMPGFLGRYCALSGVRLNTADAVYAGVVDYVISSNHYADVIQALTKIKVSTETAHQSVSDVLTSFAVQSDVSMYQEKQTFIDGIFCADDIPSMLNFLQHDDAEWSQAVLAHLQQKSPMSLMVTLEMLRRAQGQDLAFCLKQCFILIQSFLKRDDLYAGIRAVIVDKDHQAVWQPSSLDAISYDQILDCFAQQGKEELVLV